jgi:thymidylate synthase ThyX
MRFTYPEEQYDADEQALLERYFTNTDAPVFGLVNLPEAVKAAMFARYSRYSGSLRRLFLDEFAASLPDSGSLPPASAEGQRASELFERVFVGFGDDSVAQLGGAHIACEWCSNVLTKLLERPRIGVAYLEQSTRYIPYDGQVQGLGYRYYRDKEFGPAYPEAMDSLFRIYSEGLPRVAAHLETRFPRAADESEAVHTRALRAKALDLLRGLLPASSLSHLGIYASGQAYENLVMRLLASPLPEAREYGERLLGELKQVIPSFVSRIERPERGGRFVDYLSAQQEAAALWATRLGIGVDQPAGPAVRLLNATGDVDELLSSFVYEAARASQASVLAQVQALSAKEKATMLAALVGVRENRRHKPGRGLESFSYVFEIEGDYAGFRDLQRHRPLTIQWQWPTPALGADVPQEVDEAGYGDRYREALEVSAFEYERLATAGHGLAATYAVCLAYRMRYRLELNAREALHLIELRSGVQGHPSYRAIAQEMHRLIGTVHPEVAAMMSHVDLTTEPRLERLLSEIRNEGRVR